MRLLFLSIDVYVLIGHLWTASSFRQFIVKPSDNTTQYRHQQMGLAMMLEKESGKLEGNEFAVLWNKTSLLDGHVW